MGQITAEGEHHRRPGFRKQDRSLSRPLASAEGPRSRRSLCLRPL